MTIKLPRLSSSAPIVGPAGAAAIQFVQWWNTVCSTIETALNNIAANTSQIDAALGLADAASSGVSSNAAQILAIQQALATTGSVTSVVAGSGLSGGTITTTGTIALNLDSFSSTRGAILYRGASGWAALPPGTAGQKLTTGGAGADPSWT